MTSDQMYFRSMFFIIAGSVGVGFGFGHLRGYLKGWDSGFNSCSAIWNQFRDAIQEDEGDVLDAKEIK